MPDTAIVTATVMRFEGDTGVQTHFRTFHHWLATQGVASRIVTPFDAPRWQVYPLFGLRRLVELFSPSWGVWWYRHWHAVMLRRALRAVLRDAFDCVIYAQCPVSAAAALAARTSDRQRVVMVVHFNVSQAFEWVGKGALHSSHRVYQGILDLEAAVLREVDALVFVSALMQREILARVPGAAARANTVIPNFVDRPAKRDSFATAEGDLVSVGTLEPRKNQEYLLEIVAAARARGRALRLTLIGDGPDRQRLESLARQLKVDDLVTFAGHIRNAVDLLPRYKAIIHCAKAENLPMALIEAMSQSRPVFAAAVGGVGEIFDEGFSGRAIALADADAAAQIIIEWWDQPGRLEAAGRAARDRFERDYETSYLAARLLAFLCDPNSTHA